MNIIKQLIKILCASLLLSTFLVLSIIASDFDQMKNDAVSVGVSANIIGEENSYVTAKDCSEFLSAFLSADVKFSGEYVTTADYLSELLEFLGYSSENGDYLREFPFDKAAEAGILTSFADNSPFLKNKLMLEAANGAKKAIGINTLSSFVFIPESGTLLGLTSYYDPSVSSNAVEMFSEGFGDFEISKSNKFSLYAVQGNGKYVPDVLIKNPALTADMELDFGNYFSAISYSGDAVTLILTMNSDITIGYEVASNKNTFTSEFKDGKLVLTVDEPQILKISFDGAKGKTIIIYVGSKGNVTAESIGSFILSNTDSEFICTSSADVKYICPTKIVIDNTFVYYPAFVNGGKVYLKNDLYDGDYNGDDTVTLHGDVYLPVSSFNGNGGFSSASYDKQLGIINLIPSKRSKFEKLDNFAAANDSVTDVVVENNKISFMRKADGNVNGVLAQITATELIDESCLRTTAQLTMSGKTFGVPMNVSILGYNSFGVTETIAVAEVRAYTKTYETVVYFDISQCDGIYESVYLAITNAEDPGIVVSIENFTIEGYKISSELGDNEFNPFD